MVSEDEVRAPSSSGGNSSRQGGAYAKREALHWSRTQALFLAFPEAMPQSLLNDLWRYSTEVAWEKDQRGGDASRPQRTRTADTRSSSLRRCFTRTRFASSWDSRSSSRRHARRGVQRPPIYRGLALNLSGF